MGKNSNFLIYSWGRGPVLFLTWKIIFFWFLRLGWRLYVLHPEIDSHLIIWVFVTVVNSKDPCRYKNVKVTHIVQTGWDLVRHELTWSIKEDCVYDFYYDSWKSLILFIDVFLSVIFLMFPTFIKSLVYTIPYESYRYVLNNSEWIQDKIYLNQ